MLAAYPASSQSPASSLPDSSLLNKINFDIYEIDEEGKIGPPDGKRDIAYEFCIPLEKRKKKEVFRIDPSLRFYSGPAGRSGCAGQYLCIGEGATREKLLKLAQLKYIQKINPCYFE